MTEVGEVKEYCRECNRDPADADGFCSDVCKKAWERGYWGLDVDEGGEA